MINYRLVAVRLGEYARGALTIGQINSIAMALFPFEPRRYEIPGITSTRTQLIFDWVLSLDEEPSLLRDAKDRMLSEFVVNLTPADSELRNLTSVESTLAATQKGSVSVSANPRNVFLIQGQNSAANKAMTEFLGALDLHVLDWSEVANTTPAPRHIFDIVSHGFSMAQALVALFTPDDEARLRSQLRIGKNVTREQNLKGQPRANVLFEVGWALGMHLDRTVIVELGELRDFTDLGGIYVIRDMNTSEKRLELANRLEVIGCAVNQKSSAWLRAGDFETVIKDIQAMTKADSSGLAGSAQRVLELAKSILNEVRKPDPNENNIRISVIELGLLGWKGNDFHGATEAIYTFYVACHNLLYYSLRQPHTKDELVNLLEPKYEALRDAIRTVTA